MLVAAVRRYTLFPLPRQEKGLNSGLKTERTEGLRGERASVGASTH